jgi:ABC-2 type transport system ATP-binding protein
MHPAIRCRSLLKRYGDKTAVDHIDLDVVAGQCLGLLGPNGAGKTTTVEMLEGLHPPDSGSIELFGQRWGEGHDHELRQRLGVQLQETMLADKLQVDEVLRLFRSFCSRGRSVDEVLAMVDLGSERKTRYHQLSGGQRQRVALATALVGAPELLFLDEPTTGLDPRARKDVWMVVRSFLDAGGTVLLTTHYMEEAATLCDRIAIMDEGKLIEEGTPTELTAKLGHVQFIQFETESAVDLQRLQELTAVVDTTQRGRQVRLQAAQGLESLRAVIDELSQQRVVPVGFSTHQATLDDVFMHLTGRGLNSTGDAQELS